MQSDANEKLLPTALRDQACTIVKTGHTVTVDCDDATEANELFDWLTALSAPRAPGEPNEALGIVERWLSSLATLNLDEIVADGGISAGMVIQQEASHMASLLARQITSEPPKQGTLTFEQHQEEMANWLGAPDVKSMNLVHDNLHEALAEWLAIPSYALMPEETKPQELSALEEIAVLHLQRFIHHIHKNNS